MATERPRFTIIVSEEMLKQIDDYRFTNRIGNRTQAVNALIRLGLVALEKEKAASAEEPDSGFASP